ncbi:MAG: hypothetical protein MI802_12000, partial [Desulfobacterales bacterium]|nr:hypothetical protein [Desulfobacterales bacterium]
MVCLGTYRVPAFMTVAWLCVWLITATLYAGETTPSEPPPEDRASVHLMDRVVDAASPGWARLLLRLDGDASGDRVTLERLRDGVTTARAALQRWLANPEDGVLSRALAIALAIQLQDGWLDPTDKA